MSDFVMEQEVAKQLVDACGVFVFLGVPEGTEFGIDTKCWNTAGEFRGIKMIPPGLHYIHYAPTNKRGDVAPRRGFMYDFKEKEFVVRMWNKEKEDISRESIAEESIQRLKDNLYNIDKFLAPYPFDIYNKWKSLSSNITDEVVTMLTPTSGIISAALDLVSCNNEERPRGKLKSSSENSKEIQETKDNILQKDSSGSQSIASTSTDATGNASVITADNAAITCDDSNVANTPKTNKRRSRPSTLEEKEEELLPHLKPLPGMALRFTMFPERNYPENATPAEITKHSLDQTYILDIMISRYKQSISIIGEIEFAYVCFLIGHSLDAFEQWKKLVTLLCSCEDAIKKYRGIYLQFVASLETQIIEIPEEFLADIVMNNNLVYIKLREFFKTCYDSDIENRLKSAIDRFKQNLTDRLSWDFSDIDQEDEDERPVIVYLP